MRETLGGFPIDTAQSRSSASCDTPPVQRIRPDGRVCIPTAPLVAIFASGLHIGALSLAPLSIVHAVLSGGLDFLAVFAERYVASVLDDDSGSV